MIFEPLTREHVLSMREGVAYGGLGFAGITDELAAELETFGGWAAVDDGETVAIGGIFEMRPACGFAWLWLTRRWQRYARAITARVQHEIDTAPYPRIEATACCGLDRAHRYLRRLGFEMEAPRMKRWGADNSDHALYAVVRDG